MKKTVILILAAGLCLLSCGKKAILRKYYLLEAPETVMSTVVSDSLCFAAHVDVRSFQISKAIDQTRIALRSDTHELNYYFYHHWAVSPSAGVADMVFDILGRKNCFDRLVRGYSTHPDYIVTGHLRHLERDETGAKISAHLAGTIELIRQQTGKAVIKHEFDRLEPVKEEKSMNAFVDVLCRILMSETEIFCQEINTYFTDTAGETMQ